MKNYIMQRDVLFGQYLCQWILGTSPGTVRAGMGIQTIWVFMSMWEAMYI